MENRCCKNIYSIDARTPLCLGGFHVNAELRIKGLKRGKLIWLVIFLSLYSIPLIISSSSIHGAKAVSISEQQITFDSGHQGAPAIYEDRVVWMDQRNSNATSTNWDIYMYDLSTDDLTQITDNPSSQEHPAIYGDIIVWEDQRNLHWDIYMYNLSDNTEHRITTDTGNQKEPAIYGDLIVWTDWRNDPAASDIYMYNQSWSTGFQRTGNRSDDSY